MDVKAAAEKMADICLAEVEVDRNKQQMVEINQAVNRLNHSYTQLQLRNEKLERSAKAWSFELYVSLSHRKFCKLMGI